MRRIASVFLLAGCADSFKPLKPFRATSFESAKLRATLRPPVLQKTTFAFTPSSSLKETSAWTNTFIGNIGCKLSASSPAEISAKFDQVNMKELPRRIQALLNDDVNADGASYSIHKWLTLLTSSARSGYRNDEAVDRFVAEVFHACDLDDGASTLLLPQQHLFFDMGDLRVISKPDLLLRCGSFEQDEIIDVVTEDSKIIGPSALSWGQIVGEMIAAGMSNYERRPEMLPPPIFGIRIVETRWTFLRVDFKTDYLQRLGAFKLLPDDQFKVTVWGGARHETGNQISGGPTWGLDYNVLSEREDLVRMIVAIGMEAQSTALQFARSS